MAKHKLSRDTLAALDRSGFRIGQLYQIPSGAGRLKLVADPADPWVAHIYQPDPKTPVSWFARKLGNAKGATADEAVLNAIPRMGLPDHFRALGSAIDDLILTMRGVRA